MSPLCLASRPPPTPSSAEQLLLAASVKSEESGPSTDTSDVPCIVAAEGDQVAVVDTVEVASCVRQLLVSRNIGQRQFARDILGLSQGTVSELLAKPKPWDRLTEKGKDSYRRMYQWLFAQTGSNGTQWRDSSHPNGERNCLLARRNKFFSEFGIHNLQL
jgi:homeobox protein cut-like